MNQVDAAIPATRRRTLLIWVISLFYVVVPLLSAVGLVAIRMGAMSGVMQSDPYFQRLGVVDLALGLAMAATEIAGASLLWLLRRHALHCFIAATVLGILNFWWHSLIRGWVGAIHRMAPGMTVPLVVSTIVGSLVLIAISAYAWRLTKAGVLK
jgi:hypothetical protein